MKFKKFVCIIISLIIILGCISVGASATNGLKSDLITTDKNSGDVTFDSPYAEIGKEISVLVDGEKKGNMIYEWYINNERIENTTNSYTPQWCDIEMMLSVKVYSKLGGSFVGNVSMLISELPVIYIETEEREPVVIKEKELDAHIKIQGNKEFNNEDILYEGETIIKGRGNTTWLDSKKPYRLKLDSKADLFGMGKNKHWVLLSNPYDNTYVRNKISYNLAGEMGLAHQKSVSIDLVLNGEHIGNYLISEHVRVGDNRVEITSWDDIAEDAAKEIYKANKDIITKDERDELIDIMTDESKEWVDTDKITFKGVTYTVSDYYTIPDINGGYLLSIDRETAYLSKNNVSIVVERPEVYSEKMLNSISSYYQAFEDALFSDNYYTEYNGQTMRYTEFIDVESFAKGLLLNELFMNKDFGGKSTFFSKDVDGKLVYGPVWDLDLSSGCDTITSYYNTWLTLKVPIIQRLWSDPYMLNEIYKYYWEYRHTAIADCVKEGGFIETTYDAISDSAYKDEEIWKYDNSFDYEYAFFTQWMNKRIEWLDKQFASLENLHISMTSTFSNKFVHNTQQLPLSVSDDILTITLNNEAVTDIKIYADGELYGTTTSRRKVINYSLSRCADDALISVICYDADGNIVCGNFISKAKQVNSLSVKSLPDKLDYNVGDKLDLTGLVLEATYDDSSKETVAPDAAITYAKDAVGTQYFNNYDIVTDAIGNEIYVSLRYKNATAEFKINVADRENYEYVEKLISKLPEGSFNEDYLENVITAKLAFDALSDEAKEKVSNKEQLEDLMNYLDTIATAPETGAIGIYLPEIYQGGSFKHNYVILFKGNPSKVRLSYNENNTTTLYNEQHLRSASILSIKEFGDYTLWTCNLTPRNYDIFIINGYSNSEPKSFDFTKYADPVDIISSVKHPKAIFENNTLIFDIETDKQLDELRITENGNVIKAVTADLGKNTIVITPDSVGTHTYSIEYKTNGIWIKYDDYYTFVREKAVNLILGDVDMSRAINSSDALLILQYSTGIAQLNEYKFKAADTNHDNAVNSSDALRVLMFTTGNIQEL